MYHGAEICDYLTDHSLQTNGIFELHVTNADKQTATWTVDMKKTGTVYKGNAKPKADVTIILSDETLQDLATGKVRAVYRVACSAADGGSRRRTARRRS